MNDILEKSRKTGYEMKILYFIWEVKSKSRNESVLEKYLLKIIFKDNSKLKEKAKFLTLNFSCSHLFCMNMSHVKGTRIYKYRKMQCTIINLMRRSTVRNSTINKLQISSVGQKE